jgi:homoserine kinase
MQQVTVRVPASTSNLGPGFDCLGVALRLYNNVVVQRGGRRKPTPMMRDAAQAFFRRAACKPFACSCAVSGDVPASRGLGSSVTVRLGVMFALNELAGRLLSREQVFELCTELEGHPDNAAPATFGGFNVCGAKHRQRFGVAPALKFILLIPGFEVRTAEARALLPDQIGRLAAVESCGNACAITASFASGAYASMRGAFRDQLHQPFRKPLIPFFDSVVEAGEQAGALGVFLSGSGSTIAAVTLANAERVAEQMLRASGANGVHHHHHGGQSRRAHPGAESSMSQRSERLEQFAIDVILERRHGVRATMLRSVLHALSFVYERLVQLRLFLYATASCGNARSAVS